MKTLILFTSILLSYLIGGIFSDSIVENSVGLHLIISTSIFLGVNLIPGGVLAVVCAPNCISDIPMVIGNEACDFVDRKGGIPRLAFLKCQYAETEPNFRFENGWANPLNVRDAICAEILFVTGEILGSKPAPSFTKKRLGSCSPEKTIAGVQTIVFSDFNHDPELLIEFDFWSGIVASKSNLVVGWITCDDLFYRYAGDWDIEIGEQSEESKEGNAFFAGVITLSEKNIITPIKCPGLNAMLNSFDGVCDYYL